MPKFQCREIGTQDIFTKKRIRILVERVSVPFSLNAGDDMCLLGVYTSVSVFVFNKQELF